MKTILELTASHFNESNYNRPCKSPISAAIASVVNKPQAFCYENLNTILIGIPGDIEKSFTHADYSEADYKEDFKKAEACGFNETVIRVIELTIK